MSLIHGWLINTHTINTYVATNSLLLFALERLSSISWILHFTIIMYDSIIIVSAIIDKNNTRPTLKRGCVFVNQPPAVIIGRKFAEAGVICPSLRSGVWKSSDFLWVGTNVFAKYANNGCLQMTRFCLQFEIRGRNIQTGNTVSSIFKHIWKAA